MSAAGAFRLLVAVAIMVMIGSLVGLGSGAIPPGSVVVSDADPGPVLEIGLDRRTGADPDCTSHGRHGCCHAASSVCCTSAIAGEPPVIACGPAANARLRRADRLGHGRNPEAPKKPPRNLG
jgi:hypothetical protein